MNSRKKLLLTVAVVAIIGGSLLTSTQVFADTETAGQSSFSPLVEKIAEHFGVDQEEVQAIFDEVRAQRRAELKTAREQAMQSMHDMTPEERRAALQAEQDALKFTHHQRWRKPDTY